MPLQDDPTRQPPGSVPAAAVRGTNEITNEPNETTDFHQAGAGASEESENPSSFGRYEVRRAIGSGGFGSIYVGFDSQLEREVAIKTPRRAVSQKERDDFLEEARKLARLRHPGILSVYDVGIDTGRCYIVCELLEGTNLSDWLTQARPAWRPAVEIVIAVADALAYAHSQGTIHRDIKPANIILLADRRPVLVDLGLALSGDADAGELGRIAGTPSYMSPEQVQGRAHRIDGRTDIYSLGVVLYEMLCGRKPYRGTTSIELVRQICEDEPQPLRQIARDVPAAVERACLKAMARELQDRYSTADDFASDLRAALHQPAATAADPNAIARRATPPARLETPPADSGDLTRSVERRQVSLLLCNAGPEQHADEDSLDPETQQEIIASFRACYAPIVQKYGGTILSSTGLETLVCFGYPTGYEDAAQRAVHAGLAIVQAVDKTNDDRIGKRLPRVASWAVVHTGPVVVGRMPDQASSLSVTGEARTVVSRLEAAADPGTTIITDAAYKLVRGFFDCKELGAKQLRGVSQPITVYQVRGQSDKRSRIDVAESVGLTPLVGRDQEVGLLRERWQQAAEGMGQVVLLIGDAGLGKSRLVHVIKQHVSQEAEQRGAVAEWRCSPYYQNTGLYPAIDFFERLWKFDRNEPAETKRKKIAANLESCGFDDAESVTLFAQLLSVPLDGQYPELGFSPQRLHERTQELLLEWLRAYSEAQPVLFVIEDLHWMDPTTLELVGKLVEQGFNDSILTILTFRPEFETPWKSKAHQTQVALNRLTKSQIAVLMQQKSKVRKIPQPVIDQIVERTDGVPLFVEEFTRVLVESGAVRDHDGELEVSGSFSLQNIPATLQDLLVARLDRMADAKEVAQLGASIGREFGMDLLSAICELPATKLQTELDRLVEADVLLKKGRQAHARYVFKHALIQDAAYESLLKKHRREIHLRIGTALEQSFPATGESQPELLARHFTEAGEPGKGIDYWFKAGVRAQQRSNHREAIGHFNEGLRLLGQLDAKVDRASLELGFQAALGTSLLATKGYAHPDVDVTFHRAKELAIATGQTTPLFFVTWGLWAMHLLRDELDTCLEFAEELLQLARSANNPGLEMEALYAPGCTRVHRGDFVAAREHLERGISLYDRETCRAYSRHTGQNACVIERVYLGVALWALGYPDGARQQVEAAVSLAEELADPFSLAHGLNHGAWVHCFRRDAEKTIEFARRSIVISAEQAFAFWEACGHISLGAGLVLARQFDEAIAEVERGLSAFRATGAELHLCYVHSILADAYLQAGEFDKAFAAIDTGLALTNRFNERYVEAELLRLRGEVLLRMSHASHARSAFEQAIDIAAAQNAKSWQLRATVSLCRLLQQSGERQSAYDLLEPLCHWFSEGHDTGDWQEARALLDSLK